MAKDKKGKGSGTKDACYHKVKSRYSVWPSAYASGALVKCRKVGAANWGNSTKKESFEIQDGVVEGAMPEPIDPKKHKDAQKKQKMRNLAIGNENPNEKKVAEKKAGGPKLMGEGKYSKSETYVKGTAPVRATYGGKTESFPKETYKKKSKKLDEKFQKLTPEKQERVEKRLGELSKKVQRGYARVNKLERKPFSAIRPKVQKSIEANNKKILKDRNLGNNAASALSKTYNAEEFREVSEGDKYDNVGKQAARMSLLNNPSPRSTPEQTAEKKARLEKKRGMKLDDHPQFKKEEVDKRRAPAELVARLSAKREGHMAQDGPNKAAYDAKQRILKKTKDKMTEEIVRSILDEAGKKCWKGYKKAGTQKLFGKTYNRCVKANEETEVTEGRAEDAQASLAKVKDRQKVLDAHEKKTGKKLDITKTPEYKSHKQNFPGAKRTGKKVPGAKETPSETHNRRVNKTTARIVDRGYTSKEKKEVEAMAKHASRFD